MFVTRNLRWGHFYSLKVHLVASSSFSHHLLPLLFLLQFVFFCLFVHLLVWFPLCKEKITFRHIPQQSFISGGTLLSPCDPNTEVGSSRDLWPLPLLKFLALSVLPLMCFKWDPTWQSSEMGGMEGKEKTAFKAMGFFCFVLPTLCKRYQLMPLTLSHTCACPPPHVWRRNTLQKIFHCLRITCRQERDQNIYYWHGLKVVEFGVLLSQGAVWQKVTKLY